MTDRSQTIHITPKVLDFGTRIVALAHVTSVAITKSRPFMPVGVVLLLGGIGLIGFEIVQRGLVELLKGGSTRIWIALVASGLGIFAQVYQRRGLVVSIADGSRVRIDANRNDFCQSLVTRIGEAMLVKPEANLHYVVDVPAQTIEIAADGHGHGAMAPVGAGAPPSAGPAEHRAPDRRPLAAPPSNWAPPANWPPQPQSIPHEAPVARDTSQAHAPVNGQAAQSRFSQPATIKPYTNGSERTLQGAIRAAHGNGSGLTPATAGPIPASAISSPPVTGPRDLDMLIDFVSQSEIQHKDALLNLLKVVDDYAKGGPTHRDDAFEHWKSFSSYVHQYLTDIDGLAPLTERAGRRFERR